MGQETHHKNLLSRNSLGLFALCSFVSAQSYSIRVASNTNLRAPYTPVTAPSFACETSLAYFAMTPLS